MANWEFDREPPGLFLGHPQLVVVLLVFLSSTNKKGTLQTKAEHITLSAGLVSTVFLVPV